MKVTWRLASQVPIWEPSGEQTDCPGLVQVPDEVPAAGAGAGAGATAGADAAAGAGAGAEAEAGDASGAGAGAVGAAMGAMAMLVSCRAAPPAAGDGLSSEPEPEPELPPVAGGPTADLLQSGSASRALGSTTREVPGLGYFKS